MVASDSTISQVIAQFHEAADIARHQETRRGSLVDLGLSDGEDVLISTDLHGQRLNFKKILKDADLSKHPRRHLVMQEVCHGGPLYPAGGCMSHLLLEDIAQLQIQHPERFHFLLSNHELAEATDFPITKGNRMLNLQFRCGLQAIYGDACEDVRDAAVGFITSCPLAIRTPNRVFISHSAPASVDEMGFDVSLFDRELEIRDMSSGGEAFRLVWGRDFRPENAEAFAKLVDADLLIHGHEPCLTGSHAPNRWQIILDCARPNAHCLLLPMREPVAHDQAIGMIRPLFAPGDEPK